MEAYYGLPAILNLTHSLHCFFKVLDAGSLLHLNWETCPNFKYRYRWLSGIDTSIGIGIAESQTPILVSVSVSLV